VDVGMNVRRQVADAGGRRHLPGRQHAALDDLHAQLRARRDLTQITIAQMDVPILASPVV